MNILSGIEYSALHLNVEENYNSVPGLRSWFDGKERILMNSNPLYTDRISLWEDKSIRSNNFTRANPSRSAKYEKGLWVYSDNIADYMSAKPLNYNFLNNGSRFAIYLITKNTWSTTTSTGLFGPISFSAAGGTGLQGTFSSSTSNGRWGFILRGGALTSVTRTINNLLLPGDPNYSPSDQVYVQSFVNFGQTNGIRLQYGNAVLNTTPFYSNLADYPQGSPSQFWLPTANTGQIVRVGLMLIYDWTLFNDTEVIEFDQKINELLAIDRPIFEALDLAA